MKKYLTSVLAPPVGACRYGCGTHCAAPITVFWLFGLFSIVYGFFGGPTGASGVSWATILQGVAMWAIAAIWNLLTLHGLAAARCDPKRSPQVHQPTTRRTAADRFEEIEKAH